MTLNPDKGILPSVAPIRPGWRCRPDGSQVWRRIDLSASDAGRLRRRAAQCGVTTDAWLNVALTLGGTGSIRSARSLERVLPRVSVRHPSDRRLRDWQRYLEEQDGPGLSDELPEVVLSKTAIGIGPDTPIDIPQLLALTDSDWDLARRCEIRAVGLKLGAPAFFATASALAAS